MSFTVFNILSNALADTLCFAFYFSISSVEHAWLLAATRQADRSTATLIAGNRLVYFQTFA
jgi:hypothetical protein